MFNQMYHIFLGNTKTEYANNISTDASNNTILRDASGNIISIPIINNINGGGFNPFTISTILSPIDEHGNRVRKR